MYSKGIHYPPNHYRQIFLGRLVVVGYWQLVQRATWWHHALDPKTRTGAGRRQRWVRRSPARCASGGRRGRGGGRPAGSSGAPPRRSAPSDSLHSDSTPRGSLYPWIPLGWFHQSPLKAEWAGYMLHIWGPRPCGSL